MFFQLFQFFVDLFAMGDFEDEGFLGNLPNADVIEIYGVSMSFSNYLALLCSLISLVVILILCCLFVYKLVRIVAGLMTHI